MKSKFLYLILSLFIFTACDKGSDPEPSSGFTMTDYILVGNEGAFGGESASLTVVNRVNGTLTQNAFSAANNGAVIGDLLQSMERRNDEIYLVVNNSEKIEVVDVKDLTSKRVISGFESPRYIHFTSDSKAYVSNLMSNHIDVINPLTGVFSDPIPTPNFIEKMKEYDGELWCTAAGSDHIYFLDLATDQISDSLKLSAGVSEIAIDENNDFWVLAQGSFSVPLIEPAIYRIDADSKEILDTFNFPEGTGYGGSLEMSADKKSVLYLVGGKLYRMSISATSLPNSPFISKPSVSFYALNVNPSSGEIALTNAVDYSQTGHIYFFKATGESIDDFNTGIIPHSVLWVNK